MRLAFFGTPDFAVPALDRLLEGPDEIVVVVSQPDRPRGRGRRTSPSPVALRALAAGLPLLRPEQVGAPDVATALAAARPDLGVVVAFGQFLPRRIRELPALGYLVNGHASLLPRHRGAAPIQWSILAGDDHTGVSVMRVEREMDAGAVALQRAVSIGRDETGGELGERIAALTADALAEALEQIAEGRVVWTPQDEAKATTAPKLSRADAALDWRQPAELLVRRIRAFAPSPGAFCGFEGEALRILAARSAAGSDLPRPGSVSYAEGGELRVATGRDWLVPLRLQRAGGKPLGTAAFLRGRSIPDGSSLA